MPIRGRRRRRSGCNISVATRIEVAHAVLDALSSLHPDALKELHAIPRIRLSDGSDLEYPRVLSRLEFDEVTSRGETGTGPLVYPLAYFPEDPSDCDEPPVQPESRTASGGPSSRDYLCRSELSRVPRNQASVTQLAHALLAAFSLPEWVVEIGVLSECQLDGLSAIEQRMAEIVRVIAQHGTIEEVVEWLSDAEFAFSTMVEVIGTFSDEEFTLAHHVADGAQERLARYTAPGAYLRFWQEAFAATAQHEEEVTARSEAASLPSQPPRTRPPCGRQRPVMVVDDDVMPGVLVLIVPPEIRRWAMKLGLSSPHLEAAAVLHRRGGVARRLERFLDRVLAGRSYSIPVSRGRPVGALGNVQQHASWFLRFQLDGRSFAATTADGAEVHRHSVAEAIRTVAECLSVTLRRARRGRPPKQPQ